MFFAEAPKKETPTRELSRKKRPESGRRALVPPFSPRGIRGLVAGGATLKKMQLSNGVTFAKNRPHNTNYVDCPRSMKSAKSRSNALPLRTSSFPDLGRVQGYPPLCVPWF